MSDTPKTDAQVEHVENIHNEWICRGRNSKAQELFVPADFARQIERELDDAKRQLETLTKANLESTSDACVDGGAFTYNDWQEIRRRLQVELEQAKANRNKAALQERQKYLPVLSQAYQAAKRFCCKVESGNASSTETYADMKRVVKTFDKLNS